MERVLDKLHSDGRYMLQSVQSWLSQRGAPRGLAVDVTSTDTTVL